MLVNLEEVFEHSCELPPLVIVDLRVILYCICPLAPEASNQTQQVYFDWQKCVWVEFLNNPLKWLPEHKAGYRVVVVDDYRDNGKYWRNLVCEEKGLPVYKGNRDPERPFGYDELHSAALEYLESEHTEIPVFREQGFEADDFAGLVYHFCKQNFIKRETFLVTTDTDWSQLVSDNLQIYMANPKPYYPRLRSNVEVLDYAMTKNNGITIFNPKEISWVKHMRGDVADNLLPGSPIGLFDLINPIYKPNSDEFYKYLSQTDSNIKPEQSKGALNYMNRKFLPHFDQRAKS